MARTEAGRKLTERHKRDQITLAATASALTVANAVRLDVDDLDGSAPRWLARQLLIVDAMRAQSARLARQYVAAFRAAEGMEPAEIAEPDLSPAVEAVAWVVPTIKARIRDASQG